MLTLIRQVLEALHCIFSVMPDQILTMFAINIFFVFVFALMTPFTVHSLIVL